MSKQNSIINKEEFSFLPTILSIFEKINSEDMKDTQAIKKIVRTFFYIYIFIYINNIIYNYILSIFLKLTFCFVLFCFSIYHFFINLTKVNEFIRTY